MAAVRTPKRKKSNSEKANSSYYEKYKEFTELGSDLGLTAPQKMKTVLKIATRLFGKGTQIRILDIGGVYGSFSLFKKTFPESEIWTVNISKEQIEGCEHPVYEDVSQGCSLKPNYFDFVFCGDVIEHIIEPDKLVKEIHGLLKSPGYFILTTPNLASFANRFSLLFGFAPTNYHPSEKRHGSLFGVKPASWHKSVFTIGAMKGFLREHGFKVISVHSFSYQKGKAPKIFGRFLPEGMGEGMIVLAQK